MRARRVRSSGVMRRLGRLVDAARGQYLLRVLPPESPPALHLEQFLRRRTALQPLLLQQLLPDALHLAASTCNITAGALHGALSDGARQVAGA